MIKTIAIFGGNDEQRKLMASNFASKYRVNESGKPVYTLELNVDCVDYIATDYYDIKFIIINNIDEIKAYIPLIGNTDYYAFIYDDENYPEEECARAELLAEKLANRYILFFSCKIGSIALDVLMEYALKCKKALLSFTPID